MIVLLGKVALVVGPAFSSPWMYHTIPLWPEMFLLSNQDDCLIGAPSYVTTCFSLMAFRILSLSVSLDILIIMCLGVELFGLTCLGFSELLFPSPN